MKDIVQICKSLSASEVRFIKSYYRSNEEKKRLKLFNLAMEQPTITDDEAATAIYGSKTETSFSHLKSRLKKDILTLLLLNEGFSHSSSAYRQAELNCRRLLIEGDILLKRGVYQPAVKILLKASRIAEEHDLPMESILIDDILRTHIGFKNGIKQYNIITEKINKQLLVLQEMLKAKELYNQILLPNIFQNNREQEYIALAQDTFRNLGEAYERTKSPNIGYLYHLSGLYYFDFIKDSGSALSLALGLAELVDREPAIRSEGRVANANLQIASILMGRYEFKRAADYAKRAVAHFKPGLGNELIALEQLFYAQLRAGDTLMAQETLDRAFNHPKLPSSALTKAKWVFAKAGMLFCLKRYDESLQALYEDNTLLQDKSGYLFGIKLLELMNFMEQGQYDFIYFRAEALRKLLQRQKNKHVIRIKAILQILLAFEKQGYDYEATYEAMGEHFRLLQSGKDDYYWSPVGFEIVRFDVWFRSKVAAHQSKKTGSNIISA
ncbi:MAG: hypothetical protein SFW35_13770 [Chitinophagales bacterium]|nr:hypothetical protein [Chitinophagales bacterium]